ncbi:hypothetical protein C0J52_10173, partial [Blattella germanica]
TSATTVLAIFLNTAPNVSSSVGRKDSQYSFQLEFSAAIVGFAEKSVTLLAKREEIELKQRNLKRQSIVNTMVKKSSVSRILTIWHINKSKDATNKLKYRTPHTGLKRTTTDNNQKTSVLCLMGRRELVTKRLFSFTMTDPPLDPKTEAASCLNLKLTDIDLLSASQKTVHVKFKGTGESEYDSSLLSYFLAVVRLTLDAVPPEVSSHSTQDSLYGGIVCLPFFTKGLGLEDKTFHWKLTVDMLVVNLPVSVNAALKTRLVQLKYGGYRGKLAENLRNIGRQGLIRKKKKKKKKKPNKLVLAEWNKKYTEKYKNT